MKTVRNVAQSIEMIFLLSSSSILMRFLFLSLRSMYVKCIDFHDNTNFNASIFTVIIDAFFALDLLMVFIVKSNVLF